MPFSRQHAVVGLFWAVLFLACAEVPSGHSASETLQWARGEIQAGRFRQAEAALASLGRARDVPPEAELLLGRCFRETGDDAAAMECFYRAEEAAERAGDRRVAYLAARSLGVMAQEEGRRRLALEHFNRAFPSAKTSAERDALALRMSRLEWELGRGRQARAYLSRVRAKQGEDYRSLAALMAPRPIQRPRPSSGTADSAPSAPAGPPIIPRSAWGADPVLASGDPTAMTAIHRITIHHAADGVSAPTSRARAAARLRSYQADHQGRRGWADIGYHFVIDGAGRIWEGRPLRWQGAHAGNSDLNRGNIGICLMGNFEATDLNVAQARSLSSLLDWLLGTYHIAPRQVRGHGELLRRVPGRGTACPGERLQTFLSRWRRERGAAVSARKRG